MKRLIYFLIFVLLISGVYGITIDANVTFSPTDTNVSYYSNASFTCDSISVDANCVYITGGVYDGTYCYTSSVPITVQFGYYGGVYITFYNQETLGIINDRTINVDFVGSDFVGNFSTATGTLFANTLNVGDYSIFSSAAGYSTTNYYVTILNNSITYISIYMLNVSNGQTILANIYDQNGNTLEGYLLKTLRLVAGQYRLVEISKSNFDGQADFYGVLNTPSYYWIIEKDGVIYEQTSESEIYSNILDFYISTSSPVGELYDKIESLVYYPRFDNSTNSFVLNWVDSNNFLSSIKIAVYELPRMDLIATNTSTLSTGTMTINMNPYYKNETTYIMKVTATFSPDDIYITSISHTYPAIQGDFGTLGVLVAMFILIVVGFVGFWNPAVMLLLEGIAFALTRVVGLHQLETTTTTIVVVLCLIGAYLISDRT